MDDRSATRLGAALRRLPDIAVFSGRTAAWLHGLEPSLSSPIEVTLPAGTLISRRAALKVHRCRLDAQEVVVIRGVVATSAVRTIADLAAWIGFVDAMVVLDFALHERQVSIDDLRCWIDSHKGWKGVARLRKAVELAEQKTESAMETRLRLLLVLAGLPKPDAQVSIYDDQGAFLGRPDLYYPEARLGLEYDGASHRESLAADNRRQNRLQEAGYLLLRFTATDVP